MKGPTAALLLSTLAFPSSHTDGFRVRRPGRLSRLGGNTMMAHRIGVYYGTVGQNTEAVAVGIVDAFKASCPDEPDIAGSEPMYIDDVESVSEFLKYDSLVLGCPTWNTGADEERSGTAWDDLYYDSMQELSLAGKKVACFGCGDSIGYGENFCDAVDELHSVCKARGAEMFG